MRIHHVKLKNFVSHKDTSIEFPPGLTVIIGRNGAGKTSIFDGISYALFKEHSRGKDENIINRGAASAQVQLVFSSGGRTYEITWRIGKKKRALATLRDLTSGSKIFIDAGERTAVPEIEKIIGISRDIFLNAAYVRQGEIAKFLEVRPAERKEIMSKLLGIDSLEKIWENLRTPISVIEEKLRKHAEKAEKEEEIKKQLNEIEKERSELQESVRLTKAKLSENRSKINEAREKIRLIDEKRRKYEGLKERIAELERKTAEKEQELNGKRKELELVQKAQERINELEKIREEYSSLEREIQDIEKKVEELKNALKKKELFIKDKERMENEAKSLREIVREYLKKLRQHIEIEVAEENFDEVFQSTLYKYKKLESQLRSDLQRLAEKMGELQGRKKSCLMNIEEIESGAEICPTCKRPLTPDHKEKVLRDLKRELGEVDAKIESLTNKIDEASLKCEKVSSLLEEFSKIDPELFKSSLEKYRSLRDELNKIEEELKRLGDVDENLDKYSLILNEKNEKMRDLRKLLEEYEKEKVVIEKLGSPQSVSAGIHRISSELKEMKDERRRLESELAKLRYDPVEYQKAVEELDKLNQELAEKKSELATLMQKMDSLRKDREKLEKELAESELAKMRVKFLERYLTLLKAVRSCFGKDGVQRYARAAARKSIEHYARRFLRFFTIAYSDLRLDDDYNVYVYGPMGEQSIDALSGGEKTSIAICLRLGVAVALTGDKMECILMDEPTTHLDPERRRELIKLLTNFRRDRGLIPQAIIVTHDAEVEEAADQVYHLVLEEGYSRLEAEIA